MTKPSILIVSSLLAALIVAPGAARAAKHDVNACGCYSSGDTCYCEKGAKCGCPGNCEPKGCEEARQKQLEKEIAEEMKKAKDSEKAKEAEKSKHDAQAADGDDDAKSGDKAAKPGKAKMTAAQKKQLLKLLDVYMGDHPDAKEKTLTEVRGEL
jgi:hypothetical protein